MIGPDSLVSIIMPVLNPAPFLAEAIESAPTQTCRHPELLAVEILGRPHVVGVEERDVDQGWWAKYRRHPGSSTGARRERKTREARERFLTWLEDHCRAVPSASPGSRRTIRRERWRCRHRVGDWLLDRAVSFRRRARGRSGWG